jgi:hypothetical protein
VLRGLPENRTTIGAALVDSATEVTSGIGIAVTGTILAALFTGDIATPNWSAQQTAEFREAVTIVGLTLTATAAALVGWGFARAPGPVSGRPEQVDRASRAIPAVPTPAASPNSLVARPRPSRTGRC